MHNPQLDLAYNFVQFTDRNIFLTGKAGTGKTTFLQNLKKTSLKRMVVVAPTGVAAINAGGTTIHSFFQLPFGPYLSREVTGRPNLSDGGQQRYQRFNRDKINLLRSLDLLVIDEISMVRADTLDGIDDVLRRYRDRSKPFGGVQLLMIGDLHQLSPVVKDEDWKILRDYYPNLYFFSSRALQQLPAVPIELKHIYRQSDRSFIDLLNTIRQNSLDYDDLERLNTRHIPGFRPADDEGYITLTTHNATATAINEEKLAELDMPERTFRATINGDFPDYAYPTLPELVLKIGAQVMFVKNDPSREKLFYNGKIGRVTGFTDDAITVSCAGDTEEINVIVAEWRNISYTLNDEKEVEESVAGSFIQYPLKLAWAITIHKSQGLTFEKAIIDAAASFAHGQVYVALSRCKSFEGLVLRSPIGMNSIKTDHAISDYTLRAVENSPGEEQLQAAMSGFQQSLLLELFDFTALKTRLYTVQKLVEEHDHSLNAALSDGLYAIRETAGRDLYPTADSFRRQLAGLFVVGTLPENDEAIQDRLKKAAAWFFEKIEHGVFVPIGNLVLETDNREVRKTITEAIDNLRKEAWVKLNCLAAAGKEFNTIALLKVRADAELDYRSLSTTTAKKQPAAADTSANPELYAALKEWRDEQAAETNVPVYVVLPIKSMTEIAAVQPVSIKELANISGIGKAKLEKYGDRLLELIARHRRDD